MGEPVDIRPLLQPRRIRELAAEAQNFKAFKTFFKHEESSRVLDLAFSPVAPHRLAVVSGTKVGLWRESKDKASCDQEPAVSKFKDLTQCVSWRSDGRLLLAGEASGSCAVIEADTRKVLRRFRGHGDAVTCAAFASADKAKAATGGRDGKLRIWDVASCELLQTVTAHTDCIKCLAPGPGGPDAWISAGYDGKARLWDLREAPEEGTGIGAAVACVDHGHPIETGAAFPGGAMYVTAGGPAVKMWDFAAGGRLVQSLSDAHSKAITACCLDSQASVLLTASFDGLAKVFQAADLTHLFTYRFDFPATCAAWRPDDGAFVVGFDDGKWQLRQRSAKGNANAASKVGVGGIAQKVQQKSRAKREGPLRGQDAEPGSGDEVVEAAERPLKKRKESQLDFLLRKFEYRKCVEFLVKPSTSAEVGLGLVDELLQRGALVVAFSELGEDLCLALLRWLLRAFATGDSLQQQLFWEALHTMLDCNSCLDPPSTPELLDLVNRLEQKVTQEMKIQESFIETCGMLKTVMTL